MNLYEMLRTTALKRMDRPALLFKDRKITYGELLSQVDHCAANLESLGFGPGKSFGLVARNSPEFIIVSFALFRIGAASVPINFLEKPDRISLILADAGAEGCLTSNEFLGAVLSAGRSLPALKHIFTRDEKAPAGSRPFRDLLAAPAHLPFRQGPVGEDALAMLLYTSGTTGQPKGVELTHKNFVANTESCLGAIGLSVKDIFLCLLPVFHSFAWTTCVLIPLKLGSQIVIIETLQPFEPVIQAIWKHKTSVFVAVPPIYAALASRIKGVKALVIRLLNPVRVCISGAAALPMGVLTEFEKRFGVMILEGYGLTETSPVLTLNPAKGRQPGTVGTPIPGVEIKIIDEEEKPLPVGTVGEICARGANIMRGYHHKPEETRQTFTRDGWLKTGDVGFLNEKGFLTIADRKKDLIIVKGLNVYPQEVENALLEHPAVAEAAVVGVRDETGDEMVRAFVVLKTGENTEKSKLLHWCRGKLAAYKCPKDIEILRELPKNAIGKILKKDLRTRP
jgi:long-chain acyl-CoA synthetase